MECLHGKAASNSTTTEAELWIHMSRRRWLFISISTDNMESHWFEATDT
jgi:hypothetical protein